MTDDKIVADFMSSSQRYFQEDVFVFEWKVNVIEDTFHLLNNFSFTVYLLEILTITPI